MVEINHPSSPPPPSYRTYLKYSPPPYRKYVRQSPDSRIQGPDQILSFAVRNQLKINRFISHEIHGNQFEVVAPLHQCPLNFPLKKGFVLFFARESGLGHMFQKQSSRSPILFFCIATSQKLNFGLTFYYLRQGKNQHNHVTQDIKLGFDDCREMFSSSLKTVVVHKSVK